MAGQSNSYTRWNEQMKACFLRGTRDYREGLEMSDCPYVGSGFNQQRRKQWVAGWSAAQKRDSKYER